MILALYDMHFLVHGFILLQIETLSSISHLMYNTCLARATQTSLYIKSTNARSYSSYYVFWFVQLTK